MGTLAAGIKDIFSTAKTTGTNVMLSGNDGTPDGHITMANLASVLGVDIHNPPLTDLNMDEKRNVFGVVEPSTLNTPYAGYGIVSHLSSGQTSYCTQLVFMHTPTSGLYIRYKWNVWTAWQKIELNIPAFYKSYSDLASLSSALGYSVSTGGNTNTEGWYKVATYRTAIGGYNSFINIRGMMNNYSSTDARNVNIACAALDGSRPTFHVIEGAGILGFVQDNNVTNLYAKPLRGYGFVLSFLTNSTTIQIISTPDVITTEPEGLVMLT